MAAAASSSCPHGHPGDRRPWRNARPDGLYDPAFEHDACGVGMVADLRGRPSHDIVTKGLTVLRNLDHRGALGSDPHTGDGAGVLTQIPDALLRASIDFALPEPGAYAAGIAFLPRESRAREVAVRGLEVLAAEEGLRVLGWRELPHDPECCGASAHAAMPHLAQLFLAPRSGVRRADPRGLELDRLAFCFRKRAEHDLDVYFPSLSSRTIVYKGMLTPAQLGPFFPDLTDPRFSTSIALVHSRFSTNTFPSWQLAHPFRYIAHNGEINTVKGNRNWMRAREALLSSAALPGDLKRIFPLIEGEASDTASFDECLELLHLAGRSLPHAVLMMIPEAWERNTLMDPARRAFYEFHATMMEAWDGPASVTFTDGTVAGAVLDRNGLRPGRYWVTDDGLVILASEAGVLDIEPARIVRKGRLRPGRIFLVDTARGRIVDDDEVKAELAAEHPYADWLHAGLLRFEDLRERHPAAAEPDLLAAQRLFGYTSEELKVILAPMARTAAEPVGSMGDDTPLAVLSDRPRLLFDYFKQMFAQVTNPPLDAIREKLVTSLATTLGPEGNLLEPGPHSCRRLVLPSPVLASDELATILKLNDEGDLPGFAVHVVRGTYDLAGGGEALRTRLAEIRAEVSAAIAEGARIIVLSDRGAGDRSAPIPSLLLTGAVHHHLIQEKSRTRASLIVETGDARESHHMALLLGYGASAINPYLALETVADLARTGKLDLGEGPEKAVANLAAAYGNGVLKIMSKMGVSTVASYIGSQIFEALGLGDEVITECFTGTPSRLGGVGFGVLAEEVARRHVRAAGSGEDFLDSGGQYQWRRNGEAHLFNPETVFKLQHSTRARRYEIFKEYTSLVDEQAGRLMTLRGMFRFREETRAPVPLEEVEPVSEIVKRFSTGAMSYGSLSAEAHETLAIAMNRLGGKSNSGEGGEDPARLHDERRSAIKQVASGRFGVTSEYLVSAEDIQIKMAQGAKPGEGGQLPGHKVYPWIARTRHSTPGVGLISPPPHHDIYSIEDLAQLIHDLKNANPAARIHVKLVSEVGVGTVAAGVAKAHADVVLVSGHDGGTGASPLSSVKHAGVPWELGLAETQQTLMRNGLRDRITVQTDGQMKTGRDVIVAALLGAEEYGFATAPLVVSGCVLMRACHLDTCPVGVATQNPRLRERFTGKAEFVVNFFEFVAQEVREYLARLGFRTLDEAIGQAELLDATEAVEHWKAAGLDLSPVLHTSAGPRRRLTGQDHGLEHALDNTLIQLAEGAIAGGDPVRLELPVRNVNRTVGTMLGNAVTRRWGGAGLPGDTIDITFTGSAGQSFGAFVPRGVTLRLAGEANDYVGKGLSGGRLVLRPAVERDGQVIAGNVLLYGATSGEAFVRGVVGERFCVRNSGALAVTEGTGDHGCEYMTGGRAVILGPTGRNFAAGMSGGIAYVLDLDAKLVNTEMVGLERLDDTDREFLRETIARHHAETGSPRARGLLADWDISADRFTKIMPTDYKRALAALSAAAASGRNADEAVMEAAHG